MNKRAESQVAAKPTYIFDFDSTLVTVESLDELAAYALKGRPDRLQIIDHIERITNLGMSGKIKFDESLRLRLKLFSASREHVEKVIALLMDNVSPSVWINRDWFVNNSDRIYVISGGFKDYILPVAKRLGLKENHVFANKFLYDQSGIIIGYDKANLLCQPEGKVKQVAKLNLPKPIIVIGDGSTDHEIRKHGQAELFCAFTETILRPNVVAGADKVFSSFEPQQLVI